MCYPCTKCNKCGRYPKGLVCINCGHENPLGSLKCEECGRSLPQPPGIPVAGFGSRRIS